jgi:hypothetical protein
MKYRAQILGLLMVLMIQSCGFDNRTNNESKIKKTKTDLFDKYSNDSIRAVIFRIAYNNKSTAPSYVVFKAKDLNTGIVKEICCEAPFLSGAMHTELNINYDTLGTEYIDSIILANRQGVFKFRNKEALNNIKFYEYPEKEVIDKIAKKNDLDYYFQKYGKNDSINSMHFETDTGYTQKVFAHIMFECGIITSRDCIAGNNIWFGDPNISVQEIPDDQK